MDYDKLTQDLKYTLKHDREEKQALENMTELSSAEAEIKRLRTVLGNIHTWVALELNRPTVAKAVILTEILDATSEALKPIAISKAR